MQASSNKTLLTRSAGRRLLGLDGSAISSAKAALKTNPLSSGGNARMSIQDFFASIVDCGGWYVDLFCDGRGMSKSQIEDLGFGQLRHDFSCFIFGESDSGKYLTIY